MKNRTGKTNLLSQTQFIKQKKTISSSSSNQFSMDCTTWDGKSPCKKLWNGDSLFPDHLPKDLTVSVIISYCNDADGLKPYTDYINDINKEVMNLTIVIRCPVAEDIEIPIDANVIEMEDSSITDGGKPSEYSDLSIAKWLLNYISSMPTATSMQLTEDNDNHVFLFLNERTFQYKTQYRSVRRVLRATMQRGFGCVLEPAHLTHSIYHDINVLRTFQSSSLSSGGHNRNFGNWLDDLSISLNDNDSSSTNSITPVCYTSSFGVKRSQVDKYSTALQKIRTSLQHQQNKNKYHFPIDEYIERTWASIFSKQLKSNQILAIQNNTYKILREKCCLTGSLVSNINEDSFIANGWK